MDNNSRRDMIKRLSVVMVTVVLALSILSSATAAIEIDEIPERKVGDYFEYDMNEKDFAESITSSMTENWPSFEQVENVTDKTVMVEVTDSEQVSVGDESYDCLVYNMSFSLSFDLKFSSGGTIYPDGGTGNISLDVYINQWKTQGEVDTIKEQNYMDMTINVYAEGEELTMRTINTRTMTYQTLLNNYDLPLKEGDTWQQNITVQIEEKSRTKYLGNWDETTDSSEKTTNYNFEVVSETDVSTDVGEFTCLKIKNYQGEDQQISFEYMNEDGIPAKREIEMQDTSMTMELVEYSYSNVGSAGDDDGIPGFTTVLLISAVMVASVATYYHKKE